MLCCLQSQKIFSAIIKTQQTLEPRHGVKIANYGYLKLQETSWKTLNDFQERQLGTSGIIDSGRWRLVDESKMF